MSHSVLKYNIILLFTALMWGAGFVFQREGALLLGPFSFNGIRCLLAALVVAPLLFWSGSNAEKSDNHERLFNARAIKSGLSIGLCLFAALIFQQAGLKYTTAGKAGFITEMGVVFVPLLAFFFGVRPRLNTWVGLFLVLAGLGFLTMTDFEPFNKGDFLEMAGALMWSIQIIVIDRTAPGNNPFVISFIQFLLCSALCLMAGLLFEPLVMANVLAAWKPLAYTGIFSSGVAFTLQIIAQQKTPAIFVSMILSLEAVFAAILGSIFLGERMSIAAMFGCLMMLSGILFAQINIFQWFFRRKNYSSHKIHGEDTDSS